MNTYGVLAIYRFEMSRTRRTLIQSFVAPVITTSLYFIVFGAAIGSRFRRSVASATGRSLCRA